MSWLARLKNRTGAEMDAPKTTETLFVVSVASPPAPFEISHPDSAGILTVCANDEPDEVASSRLALFTDRGLTGDDAQALADRLAVRDLHGFDDRRVCLECLHLSGTVTSRRCGQWRKLGNSSPAAVIDLLDIMQRCAGFSTANYSLAANSRNTG